MENNTFEDRELTLQLEVNQALDNNEKFKFNLAELEINERSHCQENIFSSLTNNTTLTCLTLNLNGVEEDIKYGHYFKDLLVKHTTLKSLHIRFEYEFDDDNIVFFNEGLQMNTTLTELSMNWTGYNVDLMPTFMAAFKHNTTLKKLKLAFDWLPDPADQETSSIYEALMHNTSLISLNVLGIYLHGPSLQKLMEVNHTITDLEFQYFHDLKPFVNHILQANQTLKSLTLRYYDDCVYEGHLSGLKANQTLTKLNLLRMKFTGNFIEFFETLREAKSLTEIGLPTINDDGIGPFAEYIKQTTTLKKIDFRLELANDSWQILSKAISTNKSITSIAIHSKHFFNDHENYLIQALMKSSTLLKLKISLDPFRAFKLFKYLRKNDTLKILSIRGAGLLAYIGIHQLIKVIKVNSTLEQLDIKIRIRHEYLPQLCEDLKFNNTMRYLSLFVRASENITETIDILKDALSVNTTLIELRIGDEKIDYAIKPALEVNRKRFYELKKSFIVLLHNIVRDKDTRLKLPLELWQLIFMQLKYSGINFGATVKRILNE